MVAFYLASQLLRAILSLSCHDGLGALVAACFHAAAVYRVAVRISATASTLRKGQVFVVRRASKLLSHLGCSKSRQELGLATQGSKKYYDAATGWCRAGQQKKEPVRPSNQQSGLGPAASSTKPQAGSSISVGETWDLLIIHSIPSVCRLPFAAAILQLTKAKHHKKRNSFH